MKTLFACVLSVAAAAACTPMVSNDDSRADREVGYSCANGESVSVKFFPAQGVASLLRNGQSIELQQQPAASGFVYSNGPNTIRGKGPELMLEIGRMVPITCTAR